MTSSKTFILHIINSSVGYPGNIGWRLGHILSNTDNLIDTRVYCRRASTLFEDKVKNFFFL